MTIDAVVIGAGHAGLAASYLLQEAGLSHVVFERGRIGETWRSQRWDSFVLNTPNWCSHLVGYSYDGEDPDGFCHRDTFVATLENYCSLFELPVRTGVEVVNVVPTNGYFDISFKSESDPNETIQTSNVVVASGMQNVPKVPKLSARIPASLTQMHAADYRNADLLPDGAVLVLGSGQSGFQVAEDLLEAGRRVYFSTSRVGRLPRRYRGRDLLEWWKDSGLLELKTSDLKDPSIKFMTVPHVSGVGERGRTVSHQHLAWSGAEILGKLVDFTDGAFQFADDAADNVRFSDEKSIEAKNMIDIYLRNAGLPLPPLEEDPRDEPDPEAACASGRRSLHAENNDVRTLIWCTGFRGSFDWINAPVDENGHPIHTDGVSPIPGLFFLGFPWLRTRKSGIIAGVGDDAEFIVGEIISRSTLGPL